MSVSWVQTVAAWEGTSPAASGSFTPAASDQLIVVQANFNNSGATAVVSGTGTYNQLGSYLNDTLHGNTLGQAWNASSAASSQTATVTGGTGNAVGGWLWEYSGVASVTPNAVLDPSPGAGTGAILGTSVQVPVGAVLLALCFDCSSSGTAAISSPSGTTRGSGAFPVLLNNYCATEYAGAGASIQPSFTSSAGASHEYAILQFLLSPSGAGEMSMLMGVG